MDVRGLSVVVTGGSIGLGLGLVEALVLRQIRRPHMNAPYRSGSKRPQVRAARLPRKGG
jgi:NAD(P)-dependent dehydrogenase (short-subunit alcohol dehydrogenase family)